MSLRQLRPVNLWRHNHQFPLSRPLKLQIRILLTQVHELPLSQIGFVEIQSELLCRASLGRVPAGAELSRVWSA